MFLYLISTLSSIFIIFSPSSPLSSSSSSLNYPVGASEVLVADHLSKVKMNFDLINKANKEKVTLHQVREGEGSKIYVLLFKVFVRLISEKGEEIFFVATPNDASTYVFELDVAKTAKESFNHQSGTYSMV